MNHNTRTISTLATAVGLMMAVGVSATAATTTHRLVHPRYAASHYRSTPPDSFLAYKVYSIDELLDQVQSNSRIRAIYARHFHVPESRVVQYMRANLVESYIPETGYYTCYCVRHNGLIYPVKQRFEQGTKVFALRNGQPVLKWVCGNPLSKFLPAVETHTVVHEMPVIKLAPAEQTDIVAPTDEVQVIVPTETDDVQTKSSSDVNVLVPPTVLASSDASTFVLGSAGGGGIGAWALAGLPVLFAAVHSTDSGSGGSNPNIKPVPETSTAESSAIVLAAGALILGLRRRSARRS